MAGHATFSLFRRGSFNDHTQDNLNFEEEIVHNIHDAHDHLPAVEAQHQKIVETIAPVEEAPRESPVLTDNVRLTGSVSGSVHVEGIPSTRESQVESQPANEPIEVAQNNEQNKNEEEALLAERKARRKADRQRRREEHRQQKRLEQKEQADREAAEAALLSGPRKRRVIKDIGVDEEDGPLSGPVPVPAEQVLKRTFATIPPPGIGPAHRPMGGVWSAERPFRHDLGSDPAILLSLDPSVALAAKARSKAIADEAAQLVGGGGSALPPWVSTHPDFHSCVAKPLNDSDAAARAHQLRRALRVPPSERPLSSVLMLAQWLVQYTDLPLEGVPQRNLMTLARHMTMRRLKKRGKAVYEAGSPPTHLYVVMEGLARQDAHARKTKAQLASSRASRRRRSSGMTQKKNAAAAVAAAAEATAGVAAVGSGGPGEPTSPSRDTDAAGVPGGGGGGGGGVVAAGENAKGPPQHQQHKAPTLGLPPVSASDAAATNAFTSPPSVPSSPSGVGRRDQGEGESRQAAEGGHKEGGEEDEEEEDEEEEEEDPLVAPRGFEACGVGATLGPGRSFGLVSPMAFAEPRSEGFYNGVLPWEVRAEEAELEHATFLHEQHASQVKQHLRSKSLDMMNATKSVAEAAAAAAAAGAPAEDPAAASSMAKTSSSSSSSSSHPPQPVSKPGTRRLNSVVSGSSTSSIHSRVGRAVSNSAMNGRGGGRGGGKGDGGGGNLSEELVPLPEPKPPLLLAVLPLDLFFDEAAPGLSKRADSYCPFVYEHLLPSRKWLSSKHFVFGRQLQPRTFLPGDVVWREGMPADTLSLVLDGTFAITREAQWEGGNSWPTPAAAAAAAAAGGGRKGETTSGAPPAPWSSSSSSSHSAQAVDHVRTVKRTGATVVLETVSHVAGNKDLTKPLPKPPKTPLSVPGFSEPTSPEPAGSSAEDAQNQASSPDRRHSHHHHRHHLHYHASHRLGSPLSPSSSLDAGSPSRRRHHHHLSEGEEEEHRERCSKLIVGEEPLLLVREDPNGIQHTFESVRRYTLRAVGPGLCTLLDLPRAFVRRYLPYKGAWTESLRRQAARRHVSDAGVETAHRCRRAYEALSEREWGEAMLKRAQRHQRAQRESAEQQAKETRAQAERDTRNPPPHAAPRREARGSGGGGGMGGGSRPGGGGGSKPGGGAGRGAEKRAARRERTSPPAHATTLLRTGSMATTLAGSSQTDVWADRAEALRRIPKDRQAKWSEGLDMQLPMLTAGVPGIQRTTW